MAPKKPRTSKIIENSDSVEAVTSKMSRANPLAVPELLAHFLSFATEGTLASCATVCKLWSGRALDDLWRHLDSVFPLLELVMDIDILEELDKRDASNTDAWQRLSAELSKSDWSRFQIYAERVRSLSFNSRDLYRTLWTPLPPNAMAMLCLHHPNGPALLPHLETLKWYTRGSPTPIIPFLSFSIKFLEVEIIGDSLPLNSFLYAADTRSPNLESFTLKTDIRSMDVEDSLRGALSTWTALHSLTMPRYYLRPSILEAAASLPNLVSLKLSYFNKPRYDQDAVLRDLPQDSFLKLKNFGFNSKPAPARKLIQKHPELFARLSQIHLSAIYVAGDADIQTFVHRLGSGCPKLTSIHLDIWLPSASQKEDVSPLPSRVLKLLFPCTGLEVLEIGHPLPITVNDADVEQMATAWPNLTTFMIGSEPDSSLSIPDDTGHSLSILSVFAKHFPKMEVLGLFFASDDVVGFPGDLYPEHEFNNLDILCVGVSAVPGGKLHDAAFLLASLCIQAPTINIGTNLWYRGKDDPKWTDYRRQWEEVGQLLEFAMRTKMSGLAKMSRTAD